ncbi:MAG: FAD-binding protein, partial [Pseudomonadota bacterium]
MDQADAIVVGSGLAGLAAAAELGDRGKKVLIVDQEPRSFLGGQAFWSLGGLFMVDTPEQRRMGIRDSEALALSDWMGSAQFDRAEDDWPRKWAEAYIEFAAGSMRGWLHNMGLRWFPVVGWAERGGGFADGHGNSVPRFHITWGTGPGIIEHFVRRCEEHERAGLITFRFRHQVDRIDMENGAARAVSGTLLADDSAERGQKTNRDAVGEFELRAPSVIVTSGGIGGNFEMVRKVWPTHSVAVGLLPPLG